MLERTHGTTIEVTERAVDVSALIPTQRSVSGDELDDNLQHPLVEQTEPNG